MEERMTAAHQIASRHSALQSCIRGMAMLAALLCVLQFATFAAEELKPNIVYILADDLGYGDLSCYGQQKFQTPNIDRLATEGMRFTQHYSGSTVCAPSRCVLMTGMHTGHTCIRSNGSMKPEGQLPMPAETVTLPKLLKGAGYATGIFGKWGLGGPGSKSEPVDQGFDEFYGYNCQSQAHNYYPDHLWHNREKIALDGKTYSHDLIVKNALAFIRANKDKPFFCYMPVTIPHASMHVPEEYVAPFRKKFPQFEDKVGKYAGPDVKNPVAAFAGMVTKLDEDVGRVLTLLKELGLDDRTIVIFTSDNGPHKEGGHDPLFFDSNGPLRGNKRDLYEGGIRVPMLARWPGRIKAGSSTDLISAFWDVLPTACELAGVKPPENIDGLSMVPTLLGEGTQKQHEYLYWEFYEQGGKRAVRMGDWKAVQVDLNKKADGPVELYDLKTDVGEERDVSADHADHVGKARQLFESAHDTGSGFKLGGGGGSKKAK
jgi:arylsulfatase A-like enzyme